jgi:hypothetical protein
MAYCVEAWREGMIIWTNESDQWQADGGNLQSCIPVVCRHVKFDASWNALGNLLCCSIPGEHCELTVIGWRAEGIVV